MKFKNKICVITGGANGIGRSIAESFLTEGAAAAVLDTDVDAWNRSFSGRYEDNRLLFMQGDAAEQAALDAFANAVIECFGHVDYLVNNACVSRDGILSGCGYDDFNYVLRLGVTAPYYLTMLLRQVFAPGAAVVNISSSRCLMSQADTESYTAAKGGITALTHALSVSLAGIARVNAVSPGWIDTGAYQGDESYKPAHSDADCLQHPAGRVGVPMDISKAVLFLCSEDAGFITGQNLFVDGGMTKRMIYHGDEGWDYRPE